MNRTFTELVIPFLLSLEGNFPLPRGVSLLLPQKEKEAVNSIRAFYKKYYSDQSKRIFVWGINPGRLGAGITGIAFTDPVQLQKSCGIKNNLPAKPELSSTFIYEMITAFGGPEKFFSAFYLTAVCPIGFIKAGKNMNYYDDVSILKKGWKYLLSSLKQQTEFGAERDVTVCLGEGKNFLYLKKLNDELGIFRHIEPLAHPRFIMQYKRKQKQYYIDSYVELFRKLAGK